MRERLLLAAHGTASSTGACTLYRLADAVAAARPDHEVDLCFLDVIGPSLADALDERPTVVVPALLSTGYHVQADIPAAVAAYPRTRVARHLGPDPLLVDALVDRLTGDGRATTVLAASGSRRAEAAAELVVAADLLGRRLGRAVPTVTVGTELTRRLEEITGPLRVATYLLAEGTFLDGLRAAVGGRGPVSAPLGAHRAVVEVVWRRYDAAAATR